LSERKRDATTLQKNEVWGKTQTKGEDKWEKKLKKSLWEKNYKKIRIIIINNRMGREKADLLMSPEKME
jgi:hypothetical protein